MHTQASPVSIFDHCPFSHNIIGYADCSLDDEQSVLLEQHLPDCPRCNAILAEVVEGGVGPDWLVHAVSDPTSVAKASTKVCIQSSRSSVAEAILPSDRFQVIRLLGKGGMSQVWLGWDVVMRRRVALKQLRSDRRGEALDQRLIQEATSLARLSHPNIVSVFEVLTLDQDPTLVMEYVDGSTLANISRDFITSERQAASILERLADAIAHAHEQGVIHRDLKPGNVLLFWASKHEGTTQDLSLAIPKITDFGLAKILADEALTLTGDVFGTPAYMAPEQTLGLANLTGPATDIYGLGAILYQMLTGAPPHVAENPVATMSLVREREPTPPRVLRPELSKDMETICLKCLQKLPKDRYASAKELRNDLVAFLEGRPISARPLGLVRTSLRWSQHHKSIVAAAVLGISLILTLVIGSLWTASTERRLRIDANEAKTQAELSEKRFMTEAERANRALEVNREHFDIALDRMNRLADLAYNPRNKPLTSLDYHREIQQATQDIYATYLDTLPPPEDWTLQEANAITLYIKYMVAFGNREVAASWLDRVKSVIPRLESEEADSPKMREFLAQHYFNAQIQAYASGDLDGSGEFGEQAGKFFADDIRHAAYVLMNAALAYSQAGSHEAAIRVANNAVQTYRSLMEQPNTQPDDQANFLENLRWHRHIANTAGNQDEANKFIEEFDQRSTQFEKDSPLYARVQETIRCFYNRPTDQP